MEDVFIDFCCQPVLSQALKYFLYQELVLFVGVYIDEYIMDIYNYSLIEEL